VIFYPGAEETKSKFSGQFLTRKMKNFRTLISKCSSCIVEFRGFFKSAGF
jgi:hypothetical protein